jgi:hypothetical protein
MTESESNGLLKQLGEKLALKKGLTVYYPDGMAYDGNPFDLEGPLGRVQMMGRGNAFDEADALREALEEIMERGDSRSADIAEKALANT